MTALEGDANQHIIVKHEWKKAVFSKVLQGLELEHCTFSQL